MNNVLGQGLDQWSTFTIGVIDLELFFHLVFTKPVNNFFIPVVKDLWNLSPCLVCAVTAQTTCAESKSHTIWTLDSGHSSISIGRPTPIVSEADCIFHILLQIKSQDSMQY